MQIDSRIVFDSIDSGQGGFDHEYTMSISHC